MPRGWSNLDNPSHIVPLVILDPVIWCFNDQNSTPCHLTETHQPYFFITFLYMLCACLGTKVHVWRSEDNFQESVITTMWIWKIKFRESCLTVSRFTCWAILLAPKHISLNVHSSAICLHRFMLPPNTQIYSVQLQKCLESSSSETSKSLVTFQEMS